MKTKKCSRCKLILSVDNFYPRTEKGREGQYNSACKACRTVFLKPVNKRYNDKNRTIVLNHYGNKCVCCGETIREFLTIDHINGFKSSPNYKQSKRCRGNTYSQIIKDGFPNDLQILCFNCNCSKGANRQCPHIKLQDLARNEQEIYLDFNDV